MAKLNWEKMHTLSEIAIVSSCIRSVASDAIDGYATITQVKKVAGNYVTQLNNLLDSLEESDGKVNL